MAETLSLEGKLDLSAVPQLHDDLMACAGKDVIVSLAKVTQLGALCVQTLIAAANSARGGGHDFTLAEPSDRVLGQLAAMGMTPEMIMEGSE